MKQYKYLLTILLIISWVLTPMISISQMTQVNPKTDSYTLDVIESSPSNFEVNNGTVLFSGSINTYSETGKELKKEHTQIAEESIAMIEELSMNYARTKQLNEEYLNQLARQLSIWKKFADKNPSYKNILGRELQVFNRAMSLQFQENAMWTVIDSTLKEIEKLNEENPNEASLSFTRSALYTNLLISYIGLNDFYKEKYKELITLSTLSHATQENPNLNLPEEILNQIKPLHAQELKDAKVLIYDQKNNIDKIKEIGAQTKEINDFYKKVNQYSISEIDNILSNLKKESKNLTPNATNFLAENKMDPLIDDYINYYSSLKSQLEEQVVAQEMKEAALIAIYDEELTQISYTGMLYPGMEYAGLGDWASSAWNAVKTGTKVASGAAFAAVDYTTGKISETICEATDKASAMYDKGVFSDEYKQWSQAYDQAGDGKSIVSIKDTFINPLMATMKGDDKHGLGQSAVNKAQGSFAEFDKYAADKTGSNFLSQVALNTVTCGGYGLAKDYTTINDANASTGQKIVAGAGILLAVVPAISGAKVANEGTRNAIKSTVKNGAQVMDDVGQAVARSGAASNTLKNATKNLANATDDMIKAAGPNLSKADVLDDVFNAAAQNFDNAMINKVTSQAAYNQAQQTVKNSIRDGLINAPIKTIKDAVKDTFADWTVKGLKDQAIANIKSAYQDSLTSVIKSSEPFFGQSLGNAIGIKDLANFTLSNFVNNNITGGITTTMDTLINSKNDKPQEQKPPTQQIPAQQTSDPVGSQQPSNIDTSPTKYPSGDQSRPPMVVPTIPQTGQNQSLVPTVPPYGPQPYPPSVIAQDPNWSPYTPPQTPGYPIQPPYGPQQLPQTPGYTNPDLLNQYLQGQNNNNSTTPPSFNPADFDNVLTMHQQNQQNLNDNRGQQNTNSSGYTPQQDFNTDLSAGGGTNLTQHVQQLSTQTGQWQQQNQNRPPQPSPTPGPQPTPTPSSNTPPSGIPIGDGVPEQDRTNGQDDDNDGVIDEGPATGSFQMAIHDTGGDKDDQWDLKVDGQSVGRNNQGKTRFWDMNLASGQHTISATGVAIPDNVGTYTIWFGNSKVVSGPSLTGRNLNQGTTFTWTIQVP